MNARQILARYELAKREALGDDYTLDMVEKFRIDYLDNILERERKKAVRDYKRKYAKKN